MATIVIKDLQENTELDRQAMQAIAGGARFRVGLGLTARQAARRPRLFDLVPAAPARPGSARPPSR